MIRLLLLFIIAPACLAAPTLWPPYMGFFDPPFPPLLDPFEPFGSSYSSLLSFSSADICKKIDDIPGLKFPPYSEVPKDSSSEGQLLKESVKQYTYKCKNNDNKPFYMLRSSAVFATGNIHNKQNTANYYDEHKKPVSYVSLKVDHKKLWDFVEKQEEEEEGRHKDSASPASIFPYYRPFWSPSYTKYFQDKWNEIESSKLKCEKRSEIALDKYPKIDVSDLSDDDVKETKHETFVCKNPKTEENALMLKTSINIRLSSGGVVNRSQTILIPADKDGNPTHDADSDKPIHTESSQSVSAATLSAVSKGFSRR